MSYLHNRGLFLIADPLCFVGMFMKIVLVFLLLAGVGIADENATYTIHGTKDPRLSAKYLVTYVATNVKEGCGYYYANTGGMKPHVWRKPFAVVDTNYTLNIPIYLTPEEDKNACGYRFGGIELVIRRVNDNNGYYSLFKLMGDYRRKDPLRLYVNKKRHYAESIYMGDNGGFQSPHFPHIKRSQTPLYCVSDKEYFRVAPYTKFSCMTYYNPYSYDWKSKQWSLKDKPTNQFMCFMDTKLDVDGGKYHYFGECLIPNKDGYEECGEMSHPEFGVDEIKSDSLHIDISVDETKCINRGADCLSNSNCKEIPDIFREVEKPSNTNIFKKLFD